MGHVARISAGLVTVGVFQLVNGEWLHMLSVAAGMVAVGIIVTVDWMISDDT